MSEKNDQFVLTLNVTDTLCMYFKRLVMKKRSFYERNIGDCQFDIRNNA